MRRAGTTSVILMIIGLTTLAVGQAQSPSVSSRIDVTLIEVPINVVDRSGEPVRDLKAENFEVIDQGQKRAVTHFEMIDLSKSAVSHRLTQAPSPASRRNFLVLFDLNNSSPKTLVRAQQAAEDFVGKQMSLGDRVAVGTFSSENGFRLLTSFTTDRPLLLTAIEFLGLPKLYQPVDPLLLSSREMKSLADTAQPGRFGDLYAEHIKELTRGLQHNVNEAQSDFIQRELTGYSDLARVLDRIPGRKQVILLSEGFDPKMLHGRETLNSQETRDDQTAIEHGEAYKVDTDNRYGSSAATAGLSRMLEVFRRSDVVLNAVDIKGLRTDVDAREGLQPKSNESLFLLTHDTGGQVFKNANSLEDDFRRLLKSQEVVYVLAFQAPATTPGKFHDLKVRLVNVPGGRAYSRAGYYEPSPETNAMERTLSAGEIVMNQVPVNDIAVSSSASAFPRKGGDAQVPVLVEIDGRSLLREATGNTIKGEIFIYAFDDHEIVRDFVHQSVGLDVTKLRSRLEGKGVKFYDTLILPPGDYSVRTLARFGQTARNGFHSTALHVPASGEHVLLSASELDDPAPWVMVKAPDRPGTNLMYPFRVGDSSFIPAVMPALRKATSYKIALSTFNVPTDVLSVTATLQDAAGQSRSAPISVASRTAVDPDGTAWLLLDFSPPATLDPGRYALLLHVAGTEGEALSLPFEVQ